MKTANILEFKLLGTLQPWPEAKEMLERGIVSILEITQWYPGAMAGSKGEEGWKGSKETESLTQFSLTGIRLNISAMVRAGLGWGMVHARFEGVRG